MAQGGDTIVVTAQKREQRLLDVPIPVTAVSAEDLAEQNLVQLKDVYNRIPGFQYGGPRAADLSLRGITTGGQTNPTLAILIDDIPFGGTTNASQPVIPDFDPGTIERIEVLRGPQGTLYGAASLGGLIKYVTRTPSTSEFYGRMEVGANKVKDGEMGYSARGSVNVPLLEDFAALSVSGFYRADPAYLDNIRPGFEEEDVNERESWGGRASLLLTPTDNLKITLSALRQEVSTDFSDLSYSSGAIELQDIADYSPAFTDRTTIDTLPSVGDQTFALYSGRIDLDLEWAELTSITSWGKVDNLLSNDVTSVFSFLGGAYSAPSDFAVTIANGGSSDKWTQELRLGGQSEKFDWLVGFFYQDENATLEQTLFLLDGSGSLLATPYIGAGPQSYKEYAGFASVTYHATDKLDIQVGGRFAKNKQSYDENTIIDGPAQMFFGPSTSVTTPSKDDAFTWMVSPSYHFTPDIMGYARIASGYRPGGPNTAVAPQSSFGSDSVINYELGLKGEVVPGQLTVDMSVFQINWTDIQLQNTNSANQFTYLTNGGEARSRGVEFASVWTPFDGFELSGNFTYTDAELTEDLPTFAGVDTLAGFDGDRLPFSSKWAGTVSARKSVELTPDVLGYVGLSYTYVGDRRSAFQNTAANPGTYRFDLPSYNLLDLQAGLEFNEVWNFNLYVRNLTNEEGVIAATTRNGTNTPRAVFTQPRTIGFTLSREF
ncbi:TonB-dependent receptor [Marinicaulis flavus]|uniref:TonB-dependent receptor n=2 Tax=Hyphococcus luteus TaxID=2058213 RepID=A0A2S7K261_9PROT|nr:TonB-dependent receptor [Marinicaulis flavus]